MREAFRRSNLLGHPLIIMGGIVWLIGRAIRFVHAGNGTFPPGMRTRTMPFWAMAGAVGTCRST